MSYKGEFNQWERALSLKQAWNCEMAHESRCRCRCRGAAHGKRRLTFGPGFRDDGEFRGGAEHREEVALQLARLPADDPHHIALEVEHPLGPMRRVVEKERNDGYMYSSRPKIGVWILTLECGHLVHRKLSRRPPKQLHCTSCKKYGTKQQAAAELAEFTLGKKSSSTGTKSLVRQPAICPKCGVDLAKHSKSTVAGQVKYFCLQIPSSTTAHKKKKPRAGTIGRSIKPAASRTARKRPRRSR